MISRRHMHLVIALLLPLMVLRAMLPAGYMPVTENGTFRIAMCSDGLYPADDLGSDTTPDSGNPELPAGSGECAFANAASAAPPPSVSVSVVTNVSDAGARRSHEAPTRSVSLVRVQSARGPPALSL